MPRMSFKSLDGIENLVHTFTLRHPSIEVRAERTEVLERLRAAHETTVKELGFLPENVAYAEQVHAAEVALVHAGASPPFVGVDGLITNTPGVMLGIYVADCCAVYAVDAVTGAIGLSHAGRKGAEQGVARRMIEMMKGELGVDPANLIVQLSPCIRPPEFEIDFAALIKHQAREQGVPESQIFDEGLNTASDITRYYSYRVEKGKTGRMLALLGRK